MYSDPLSGEGLIIIITAIILVITFMRDIHNYIPETTHVTMVDSVAAVLYLQFMLHVSLIQGDQKVSVHLMITI
jgi:hypothetical protein